MNYIEETATHGEVIMGRATFSWLFLALSMLPFWLALFGVYIALQLAARHLGQGVIPQVIVNYGFIAVLLVGLWRYLSVALPWIYLEIAVTNRRIVYRHGFIARQVEEVAINRIEGVNLTQPMLGRLFGFGSLVVYGVGVDHLTLPPIAQPLEFKRAIQEAINESQTASHPQDATYN